MTICIAAIGRGLDNEELIVFATDHMISHPLGQFEMNVEKYKKLPNNAVSMLAGDPLIFDTLVKDCNADDDIEERLKRYTRFSTILRTKLFRNSF